ncbi:methyltransferase small [Catenulispora acidiphila DSM 44928]|jgi:methylase of polypeptide subunit release factors|uniref:Methyltransferase small n=1 Tax=Catenulispora acidiphila (strain DSM 44928 / JCM 14897 / NBRC 102108 / NRRL B-24433 / ID139908) TaxID=479433 RepID=C7PW85_CATAD|nr:methyltransferase [Catenulispora acidiphila]ACU73333.1 methyltransferase small [Catenulispora acidiphila DSM 44928]
MTADATLSDCHGGFEDRSGQFDLLGRSWTLLPGVFAPVHTTSTALFSSWLPFPPGGAFLEIGSGAGVTAVTAALAGCAHVTAVDISPAAVANTAANARRHGVADRVRVLNSDLFEALDTGERYDAIYWNSNVIDAPPEFEYLEELRWAFFDRGYATHHRFLTQGPDLLRPGGRMFLGFNTLGNKERLRVMADELGLELATFRRRPGVLGGIRVELSLLEVLVA